MTQPTRPKLWQTITDLNDTLYHTLQSHPIPDRVPGELNVAEAILSLMPNLNRIASALERLSPPPPAPERSETMAASAGRTYRRAA